MAQFNLKHIEAFVQVADLGTFRRAAERLNTTQPNISNRISQLENQLGDKLMERDAGSVRLTRFGRNLIGPARDILASVDAFLAATGDKSVFEGVLRLGVSEMVAHTWLRPFLTRMKDQFPEVDIELTVDLSATLSKALFARDLDLVLQSKPFDQLARSTVELGQSPYVWVAAPEVAINPTTVTAGDIARHPVLTHARGSEPFRQLDEHFHQIGQRVRLVPSSNIAAIMHMAIDGLGIACLPKAMVNDAMTDGRLAPLDYAWRPDALEFAARWILDPTPQFVRGAASIAQELFPPSDHTP